MDSHEARRRLLWHGIAITLCALLEGAVVQSFTNPRLALSAHVGGIMTGTVVVLFGLVWTDLRLGDTAGKALFWLSIIQGWANASGLVLAAAFGTSGTTPMHGAGHVGIPWQETLVAVVLTTGAGAILVCCALALWGLRRPAENRRAGF